MKNESLNRKLLLNIFLLLLFVIVLIALYNYKESIIEHYTKQKMLLKKYNEKVKSLKELENKYFKLKKEYEQYNKKFFNGENENIAYAELLTFLTDKLSKFNIQRDYIRQLPSYTKNSFKVIRLRIFFRENNLEKILKFLNELENNRNKILFIEKLSISTSNGGSSNILYSIDVTIGGLWKRL